MLTPLFIGLATGAVAGGGMTWLLRKPGRRRSQNTLRQPDLPWHFSGPANAPDLFGTLFDAVPECIKVHNRDGIIERMNRAGLAMLDLQSAEQVVGRSVFDLIAPRHRAAYRQFVQRVFTGQPGSMEFELRQPGGRTLWLETNAVPLPDDNGQPRALLAITRDISERKWMTQRLQEQHSRLQTIIESEPECVKLHARDGTIIEMNPAGLCLLDADTPQRVIGRTMYDFLPEEYHEQYRAMSERVFAGERGNLEFEVVSLNGQRRWLETHAAPLLDNDGQVTTLLAITRDIQQRKSDEAQLQQQQSELAHVCRLSTLGELASGLAHELNQPLCAISSYAESARDRALATDTSDPLLIDILERIVEQSSRSHDIIHRLRDFVRRRRPSPQPCHVEELINNVVGFIGPQLRHASVSLQLQITPQLPQLQVDRVQIEQVLMNLLSNAIQAMQEVPIEQRALSLSAHLRASDELQISLRDHGPGVSREVAGELFKPFFTTKQGGLGIGLSISRAIVEAHHGQIWHENHHLQGSIFHLLLPIAEAA